MSPAARFKKAGDILNYYVNEYNKRFGDTPTVNRVRDKYAMADVIDDVGARVTDLLDYHLSNSEDPSLKSFFNNYDRLDEGLRRSQAIKEERNTIKEQTRQRVEAWRKREY